MSTLWRRLSPRMAWGAIVKDAYNDDIGWGWKVAQCPGPDCGKTVIMVGTFQHQYDEAGHRGSTPAWNSEQDYLVWPRTVQRIPLGDEVPQHIKADYREACAVLSISAKASAAFSRRTMQAILEQQGYKGKLNKQIRAALSGEGLPSDIRDTLHAARKFGNFSAHPPANHSQDKIVDVEEGEAGWCLEVIERLIEHYYVNPKTAEADSAMAQRAAQLAQDRKLASGSSSDI